MRTIVAAGAAPAEQSLPQAAVLWCLKTLALPAMAVPARATGGRLGVLEARSEGQP